MGTSDENDGLALAAEQSTESSAGVLDWVIRRRCTQKLFADPQERSDRQNLWHPSHEAELRGMIETAGHAPFHLRSPVHARGTSGQDSAVPWRFYVVAGEHIASLLSVLSENAESQPGSEWSRAWKTKIPNMLAACGALVQVTWLPEEEAELSIKNVEHIAAASAATQNLLLCAQARRWRSYWSSGGILKSPELFEVLGIPSQQQLLGSVFLTPDDMVQGEGVPGRLRDERGEVSTWSRWVTLAS